MFIQRSKNNWGAYHARSYKKYIQDQENYDIMQDKLSVKEYEDPFKGTESK